MIFWTIGPVKHVFTYIWFMEDSNLWYYLVLGIIYLLSKAFGKKKPKPGVPKQQGADEDSAPPPQNVPEMTFEDVLRQLTGEKRQPVPPPPVMQAEISEPKMQNTHVAPSPAYSKDAMDSIASSPLTPTSVIDGGYDDEFRRERMKQDFTRNINYAIEEQEPVDYTEILTEDNGPAKAFVAQEIFARKF